MVDLSEKMLFYLLLHRIYFLDLMLSLFPLLFMPHLFIQIVVLEVHSNPFEVSQRPLFHLEEIYLEYPHPYPRVNLADQAHLMPFLGLDLLAEPDLDIRALPIKGISQSLYTLLIPG